MKQFVGPLVLLVIFSGLLYALFTYTHVHAPFSSQSVAQGVQITTAQVHDEGTSYAINAQYPQFGIPSIDTQIKAQVDAAVTEVKGYPANPSDSATQQNTLDGTFDKVYVGPDVVSLELVLSQYTGGAHPMTVYAGMNFDRATGKQLALADALALTGLTIAQLSAQASAQFSQELGDGFFPEGAGTNPENFSSFVISADTVTFIFQQYQVAPYAAGVQQISFPRIR